MSESKQEKKEHKFVRGAMEGRSACSPKKTFHVKKKRKALDSDEDALVGDIDVGGSVEVFEDREVDWEALEERARVRHWKERYGMKGASKGQGKGNVMRGGAEKEDNNIQRNEDEEDSSGIKVDDVCLKEWWDDYTELKRFPHKEIEELVHEERSHLFGHMFESEQFREKYGDSLMPSDERSKRRKYEVAAGVSEHLHMEKCDRKKAHDPRATPRCNKRKKAEEQFEDYSGTWISSWDIKPCGCHKCR